jgi:hypothetical protein
LGAANVKDPAIVSSAHADCRPSLFIFHSGATENMRTHRYFATEKTRSQAG